MNKKYEESFNTFYTDIVSNLQQKNNPLPLNNSSFFNAKSPFNLDFSNIRPHYNNNSEIYTYKVYNHSDIFALAITDLLRNYLTNYQFNN